MAEQLSFRPAVRKAAPMLISVASVSGGGKTYSSLLLAAGLAGPNGKVGMLDTENGRGEMYADSPGIKAALPNGFSYLGFDPPFTPMKYIDYLKAAESAGITALVVDSGTHEWEGTGGCNDIAEKNLLGGMPNWSMAKREHKKFVNYLLSAKLHIIICLRAREKVKMDKDEKGKQIIIPIGLQPICEKNFVFEMLVSLLLDEKTHHVQPVKVPEPLQPLFREPRLLTKADGEAIARWNDSGSHALTEAETIRRLQVRATEAVEAGLKPYQSFWADLTPAEKQLLKDRHEANKKAAMDADIAIAEREKQEAMA